MSQSEILSIFFLVQKVKGKINYALRPNGKVFTEKSLELSTKYKLSLICLFKFSSVSDYVHVHI